ncbi:MAG: DNA polymerase Y family protein [Chromatiales bacterium]|nr:DNA polymerase Y family protein [Gammaproteobacteria bacterium]MCP5352471.1 DNA polymerase Y family protein [Chromatiales bacterium]
MLWLALHFPLLPLEALTRGEDGARPLALEVARRLRLVNATAREAGVRADMSINAALALAPDLRVLARREADEERALHGLATWALQFSPQISLVEGEGMLLEIGASLRLFGGLDALLDTIRAGVPTLGFSVRDAVAPTPAAAWMGAWLGVPLRIDSSDRLTAALAGLDVSALRLSAKQESRLRGMGLHRLGQLLRLPRAGLARRIGTDALDHLDRALGRKADPRPGWQPPAVFESTLDLPVEVEGGAPLRFALHRLVLELAGFLRGADAGAGVLDLHFHHRELAATPLTLRLLTPGRDVEHLEGLITTRLERTRLPAPVLAVTLRCDDVRSFETRAGDLFGLRRGPDELMPALIERLRARLGDGQVHGLRAVADHRPERAWHGVDGKQGGEGRSRRPLWLLVEARPVDTRRLRRLAGPERIETGWWDGDPIARDYFVAQTRDGRRLWIYQARTGSGPDAGNWYLHGLFA